MCRAAEDGEAGATSQTSRTRIAHVHDDSGDEDAGIRFLVETEDSQVTACQLLKGTGLHRAIRSAGSHSAAS